MPDPTAPDAPSDLSDFDASQLNYVANSLNKLYGYLPLDVRFQAAAAALAVIGDYVSTYGTTPAEYIDQIAQLKAVGAASFPWFQSSEDGAA